MTNKPEKDRYWHFYFNLQVGRFYHVYRQRYFEARGRFVTATSLILSSAAVVVFTNATQYMGFSLTQWFAMIVTVLQAWELVNNSAHLARVHEQQKRQHIELESELIKYGDSLTLTEESELKIKRHNIEINEPPILRSLIILCRNKVADANGLKESERQKIWRGANWFTTQIFR